MKSAEAITSYKFVQADGLQEDISVQGIYDVLRTLGFGPAAATWLCKHRVQRAARTARPGAIDQDVFEAQRRTSTS